MRCVSLSFFEKLNKSHPIQQSFFREIVNRTFGASLKQKTLTWPAPFKKYFPKTASEQAWRNFGNADKASLLKCASLARHLNLLDLITKIQPFVLFAYIRPLSIEEKTLQDKLQDEFLEDDGCDDSESDGEVSRSGVEQSEDNASEVEDIEWWFDNFAAIIFLMYFEMCREA